MKWISWENLSDEKANGLNHLTSRVNNDCSTQGDALIAQRRVERI